VVHLPAVTAKADLQLVHPTPTMLSRKTPKHSPKSDGPGKDHTAPFLDTPQLLDTRVLKLDRSLLVRRAN
jgi:hypothetical protein